MKRTTYILLSTLSFLFLASQGIIAAGKTFEGIITYRISYPDNKYSESQQAMLPKLVLVSIKGNNSRTEIKTAMGNQVEIKDYTTKTNITLIDMMGQKYAVKSSAEEIEKENAKEPKVIAQIIEALVESVKKTGHEHDLIAAIPKSITPESVLKHVHQDVLKVLSPESFVIGDFKGGAQVKLKGKQMVLDISDATLKDLIVSFLGKSFRKYFFDA